MSGFVTGSGVSYQPITVDFRYDDGGSMTTIGGEVCHLCGAQKDSAHTRSRWNKRGEWRTTCCVVYACGTHVGTKANGKHTVTVGANCLTLTEAP